MSTATSPLMDKLPTEMRIRIYKLVLRAEYPLLLADKDYPNEVRFDVALLTVSKEIYTEAFDVFFEINAIRLWRKSELDYGVQNQLRCLSFDKSQWLPTSENGLRHLVDICLAFPRIKSLTIAYDGLQARLVPYLETQNMSEGLRCVDIGMFQLSVGRDAKVSFKHYGMVQAWQKVQAGHPIDLKARFLRYNRKRHGLELDYPLSPWDLDAFMQEIDLPLWCYLYDERRSVMHRRSNNEKVGWAEIERAKAFGRQPSKIATAPSVLKLDSTLQLKDLNVSQHGEELAQWLSELLCKHCGTFPKMLKLDS